MVDSPRRATGVRDEVVKLEPAHGSAALAAGGDERAAAAVAIPDRAADLRRNRP
jgi:hypothetical protein